MTDIRDLGRTALATAGLLLVGATAAWGDTTERVSVSSRGKQGNSDSISPSISAGGRFVAFASDATNLVPGDTNGVTDIFVRDRLKGRTERVSVSSSGTQANRDTGKNEVALSAGGRFVAFASDATN